MKTLYTNDCERGCCKRQDEHKQWDVAMCQGCCKLAVHNWLSDVAARPPVEDLFEVRFKNTHKGFYRNVNGLVLAPGDIVAVEASSGHDIGIVSLDGPLVARQMARQRVRTGTHEFRKIYRKAKSFDIEKWQEAIAREHTTMIQSRKITAALNLDMKIGDVEFQGDGSKAIFYYIADGRVDFRELIKRLAEEFHIRVEMRQIGVRQEAGLIGGLGVCGRELCCSQWMSGFSTVNTHAARWQELSPNPQKLTGQCGKLKCCLNHEVATYIEAQKDFPVVAAPLETTDGLLFLQKTDILKGEMFFSSDPSGSGEHIAVPVARVKDYIALNKKGTKIAGLTTTPAPRQAPAAEYQAVTGEDSITRFDKKKKSKNKSRNRHRAKSKAAAAGTPVNSNEKTPQP
jgi:cell fate regulator YaaT (PSP1 superfamily)